MTDLRTAAQQALEALGLWATGRDIDAVALNDLIFRLEAALAEPVQEHEDWCASVTQLLLCDPPRKAPCNCKKKVTEPVQEEVYWYVGTDGKYYSSNEVKLFMDANTKGLHLDPPQWRKDKGDLIPLYTAPPQQPDPDRIHTCSYYCTNPACIKAQRDELRDKLFNQKGNPNEDVQGYGV